MEAVHAEWTTAGCSIPEHNVSNLAIPVTTACVTPSMEVACVAKDGWVNRVTFETLRNAYRAITTTGLV